jgi:WD repeat-containing protein 68
MNSQSQQPPIEERNDLNDNNLNNMEMNMEQFRQYNEQIMQNRYMPKMPIEYLEQSKNIYDYETDKNLYGIAFQNGNCPRMAISSLEKSLNNKIEILELIENDLAKVHELQLEYPCTKLLWSPNRNANSILAASSDCIKLYNYSEEDHSLKSYQTLFNKKSKYCGVLTSFDWNTVNDSLLGTASVDTTCTIWDLNKASIKTQLIAHDKEVFDIQFGNDENTFISGGADGSVRLFDLRALNHSTIIYETKGSTPINKLALNLKNPNLIAALSLDKKFIYIFDSRANANVSMDELSLHKEAVTGIVWAPDNPSQLCSVSEDYSVIISNIYNDDQMSQNTNVSYTAPSPINNVDWCKTFPEWIGITFQKRVQLLRK